MKYILYGHHKCPWCDKAKSLLDAEGLPYQYISVRTNDEARHYFINELGHHTVPQVYTRSNPLGIETLIGGYEDLEAHVANKKSNN